jgi:hypothetical protein
VIRLPGRPLTVEALMRAWEILDRQRARWEQAFDQPWPSLEDQCRLHDRLYHDGDARP